MSQPDAPFPRVVSGLLNIGHAADHMFLLIFATAVASIAADFGMPSARSPCSASAPCRPDDWGICGAAA